MTVASPFTTVRRALDLGKRIPVVRLFQCSSVERQPQTTDVDAGAQCGGDR